jgi:hypothetical protein
MMALHLIPVLPLASATGVWGALREVTSEIVDGKLGAFQSLAVILAAMLAALSLVRTASDYVGETQKVGWQLAKPLVILFAVMNFSLVCSALDSVVNIFTRDIAEASDASLSELNGVVADAFSSLKDSELNAAKAADELAESEGWSFWRKLKEGFRIAASAYFKTAQVSTLTVLTFIGRLLTELVFFVFEILAALYIAILRLLGPFALAVSINGSWKNGVAEWVARYIQISLWVPVGYIVICLLTGFYRAVCQLLIGGGLEGGIFVIGLGLTTATVAAIMAIPKIASWIIASAGSGNAQAPLERSFQGLGRKFMK